MIGRAAGTLVFASLLAACASSAPRSSPRAEPGSQPDSIGPLLVPGQPVFRPLRVCVLDDGELKQVRIQYEVLRGDSLIGDRPFREVYPADAPGYAGGREWYHTNEPIRLNGQAYAKYGFPRVLAPHEVEMVGGFDGVTLFAEVGAARPLDALYVAVRHGCVFQIYLNNQHASAVRG